MIEGVTVDDSADILDRCASTTILSRLRASTCGLVSKAVTGLRVDFGVNAVQEVVTVNGLSIPVTASSFRMSKCSVAEGVTEVCATKPSFEFRGAALQDVVAVNGMSITVTASSLSEPKYSVEKGVTEGVAVYGCRHSRSLCDHYYSEQASCGDVWLDFKGGVGAES